MLEWLIPIGIVVAFLLGGGLVLFLHAQRIANLWVLWRTPERSPQDLTAGDRVKIRGRIKKHRAYPLLPVPFTNDGAMCAYRDWHVTEGRYNTSVRNGCNGVPVLITDGTWPVQTDLEDVTCAFLQRFKKQPVKYNLDNQDSVQRFLHDHSNYPNPDKTEPLKWPRCQTRVLEIDDEVTVVGEVARTTDNETPVQFKIESGTQSNSRLRPRLIVNELSQRALARKSLLSIAGSLFGLFSIGSGVFIAMAEYTDIPYSEYTPHLILIVGGTVVAYTYLQALLVRLRTEDYTETQK